MHEFVGGWMHGWMDEWVDEWVGRWMDGWMDGWTDGRTDGRTDGWTDGGWHRARMKPSVVCELFVSTEKPRRATSLKDLALTHSILS